MDWITYIALAVICFEAGSIVGRFEATEYLRKKPAK